MSDEEPGGQAVDATGSESAPLPADLVARVEALTRQARRAVDENEARAVRERRDALLAERGYRCRVREDDGGATLVCYPAEWVDGGTVDVDGIADTGRAVEVSLGGPGDPDDWDAVESHNRALVADVRAAHGDVHGDNAAALADFFGNHYAKRIEDATSAELREFRTEYFRRNAWPSERQTEVLEQSLALTFAAAGTDVPE